MFGLFFTAGSELPQEEVEEKNPHTHSNQKCQCKVEERFGKENVSRPGKAVNGNEFCCRRSHDTSVTFCFRRVI